MKKNVARIDRPRRSAPDAAAAPRVEARLSALYSLTEHSPVFASPLGPLPGVRDGVVVPRFVFFGPHATDLSWRLAFLAGFDARDLRSSEAVLGLVEFLARHAEHGYGLNLTFFPVVAGNAGAGGPRNLVAAHWGTSREPEIRLLEKDARRTGYHGFVRIETAPAGEDLIVARMRAPAAVLASPDVELVTTDDFAPFPVRFENSGTLPPRDGPLSIADDLPVQPFELTLRIPPDWSDALHEEAVVVTLSRFILRYRAFQAYGLHL
jgi:hypothetical protein